MTRYFYTDALAIAWMEEKHGFSFVDGAGNEVTVVDGAIIANAFGDKSSVVNNAYVHPDSLPLLEPKDGDLVCANVSYDGVTSLAPLFAYVVWGELRAGMNVANVERIVERNGMAFMWPESEAG
jgi:hypothetical protein